MSNQWDVRVTAPNGANAHLVAADDEGLTQRFAEFVATVREHDGEPIPRVPGPPTLQPEKRPK